MQFGGQRTDMNLKAIGKPDNYLVRLTNDVLPQPDAILTHGITPQKTLAEGISETEFLHFFTDKIATQGTIFAGYNNIRFDDEFIRFSLWRNFFDAYEWHWQLDCSRWDLIDVVRMTRALRPDGIEWPFAPDGKPSVRLELMAAINKLGQGNHHDALSDVKVSIAVARLIKLKQPKLFDYLLNLRDKTKVEVLVNGGDPLIYTSGRYPSEHLKTTVAAVVGSTTDRPGALMYDLRINPDDFINLKPDELAKRWQARGEDVPYFPVKTLSYNRCPAVAPLNVLDAQSAKKLGLDLKKIEQNRKQLAKTTTFAKRLNEALEIIYPPGPPKLVVSEDEVDGLLYEGFAKAADKTKMSMVRAADEATITNLEPNFNDKRLKTLFPLYKARNFPGSLTPEEVAIWEKFRSRRLLGGGEDSRAAKFFKRLEELASRPHIDKQQKFILEELSIYGQSILPAG